MHFTGSSTTNPSTMAAEHAPMVPVAATDIPRKRVTVTNFLRRYLPQLIVNRLFSKFAREMRRRNGLRHQRKGDFNKALAVYFESDVPLMKAVLRDMTPKVDIIAERAMKMSKRLVKNWENKAFNPDVLLQDNYKQPEDDDSAAE